MVGTASFPTTVNKGPGALVKYIPLPAQLSHRWPWATCSSSTTSKRAGTVPA